MKCRAASGAIGNGSSKAASRFLEWTVDSGPFRVCDGADSYLIEDGKIKAQTIHYTVSDEQGRVLIRADGTRPPPE
jgi:hypothetical protein